MKAESIFDRKGREGRSVEPLRDAATVILVRGLSDGPFELFLMRRHRNQAFMGGAFVFPGGRLDGADSDPGLGEWIGGLSPADARDRLQEPELSEAAALGLFMAAIRETFEEAGVLLARDEAGRPVDLADSATAVRYSACRTELHEGRLSLAELARREKIRFAPDLLAPYSHWITPTIEPRRFDTRFFLAALPEGQIPAHDRMELTESRWMTPATALAEHHAGRIVLMPPTLKTVEELNAFPSAGRLFAAARSRRMDPILPEAFRTAESFGVLLPNDPEHTLSASGPPARPGETTRIVMEGGIWRTRPATFSP
jgi:8-oxo-dGTP pyrophosphatase MutT (NUDIX family)